MQLITTASFEETTPSAPKTLVLARAESIVAQSQAVWFRAFGIDVVIMFLPTG